MTTNRSSHKPAIFSFRQGFKSMTAASAVLLGGITSFFISFFTLVHLFTSAATYDENWNITGYVANKDSYHFLIFREASEEMTPVLLMMITACGVIAAICTFNFITSKKMVNVYYSLGITRTKLFCSKYFSGLVMITLAVYIPLLITLIGNLATVGFSFALFKAFNYYTFKLILTAVTAYTVTSAVFAAVGTTFETAIFSAIILFIPDIFLYSIQSLMDRFLYGNPYGNEFNYANTVYYGSFNPLTSESSLPSRFSFLSPIFWGKEQLNEFSVAKKETANELAPVIHPDLTPALVWIGICIAVFFLAVLLFNRRKAEICGFIGSNRYLNSTVSLLAGFSVFCVLTSMFDELVTGLLVSAAAFTIVHLLLEIIVLRDLKKFAKGLYKLPIGIAVSVTIVFIFNSGLFGFSSKIPEIQDIKSVAVTYAGTNNEYGLFSDHNYKWQWQAVAYYEFGNSLVGEFRTEKDIKAVTDVHKSIVETQESDRTVDNQIQFVYTLKDGSTLKRSFDSVSPESYKKLLMLEDSDFYTEALINYFNGEIKEYKDRVQDDEYYYAQAQTTLRKSSVVELYNKYLNKEFVVTLSRTDRDKLIKALYKDLLERSVQEKYYPAETPVCFINIPSMNEIPGINDNSETNYTTTSVTQSDFSAKYADDFCSASLWNPNFTTHITIDMVNTIQVLKDMGLYEQLTAPTEFVSAQVFDAQDVYNFLATDSYYLTGFSKFYLAKFSAAKAPNGQDWSNYENQVEHMDASVTVNITDKDKISQLLNCSYTAYQQDDVDKGWFVNFITADGSSLLCYIPENKLPNNIK